MLAVSFMTIMASSCIGTAEHSPTVELGESKNTVHFCDVVDSVSMTVLSEDSTCIVGEIRKAEETNGDYFVMNQQQTSISKFDKDGGHVKTLRKVGRSKEEYIRINDFSVDEQNNTIVLLCDYTKLHVYDLSFNLQRTLDLNIPLERICIFKSDIFGYCALDNKIVNLSNGKTQDVVKGNELKSWVYSQTQVFFKTDDMLLASLECDTIIYRIEGNKANKYISFSYDGYEDIIDKYQDNTVENSNGRIITSTPVRIMALRSNKNILTMIYSKDMVVRCAMIDLINPKTMTDGIFIGYPSPEWNGHCNEMIAGAFANGEDLPIDSAYTRKTSFTLNKSIPGTVIVKYHLD